MSVVTRISTFEKLTVAFTPAEVWGVLTAAALYPRWWPRVWPARVLHDQPGLLGTEVEVRPLVGRAFRFRFVEQREPYVIRFRFYGGVLEGPGAFTMESVEGGTRVRYDIDVFARGFAIAMLSYLVPFDRVLRFWMRSVLKSLARQLRRQHKAAKGDPEAVRVAGVRTGEGSARSAVEQAAAAEAALSADEELRHAAGEAARIGARRAVEEIAPLAREEEQTRRAAEEAARLGAEESIRLAAEEESRRAAEEVARLAEEGAARLAAEESSRIAAEEAARLDAEEQARVSALRATSEIALVRPAPFSMEAQVRAAAPPPAPPEGLFRAMLRGIRSFFEVPDPIPAEVRTPDAPEPDGLEDNFGIARRYLDALSSNAPPEEISLFLATEVVHEAFPHRFLEHKASSDRDGILGARVLDLDLFSPRLFTLNGATGGGSQVAMEVSWSGVVAATEGPFVQGQQLDARLAVFLKFKDGCVVRRRDYACFEPWSGASERDLLLDERASILRSSTTSLSSASGAEPRQGPDSNFDIARSYLAALSSRRDADEIANFFAEDAVQEEFPNRHEPKGVVRRLDDIRQARARARTLLRSEYYELRGATGGGSQVAMEVRWTAVVGEATGPFAAGQALEADIAVFLKFRDGLIVRQRNYACFPAMEAAAE